MGEISTPMAERLLVCVGTSSATAELIRATKKMATDLNAEWFAVHVKTPRVVRLPEAYQNQAMQNIQLAEYLGAYTYTFFSRSLGGKIGDFARRHNITKIICGKPHHSHWKDIFGGSEVDEMVRLSGEIDVYFISTEQEKPEKLPILVKSRGIRFLDYGMALLYSILVTGLSFLLYPYLELSNLIMIYLVGVMVTAIHWGRGPAILNSVLNVLAFYFFFVPVRYSFVLEETHFIFTFAMMLLVAFLISHLTILIRRQADAALSQERQTFAMHSLSQELAGTRGVEEILKASVKQLREIFESQVVMLLPEENGKLHPAGGDFSAVFQKDIERELSVAQRTYCNGQIAGWGTKTSPDSPNLYVPLRATQAVIGVLALSVKDPEFDLWLLPEQMRLSLLESLAKQIALALEVERLEKRALA